MLRDPLTYEPIPRDLLGRDARFVYGKHTGLAILSAALERHRARLEAEGIDLDDEFKRCVLERVKSVREAMATEGVTEGVIAGYHDLLKRIELGEEEVVRLALEEGRGRRR